MIVANLILNVPAIAGIATGFSLVTGFFVFKAVSELSRRAREGPDKRFGNLFYYAAVQIKHKTKHPLYVKYKCVTLMRDAFDTRMARLLSKGTRFEAARFYYDRGVVALRLPTAPTAPTAQKTCAEWLEIAL